MDAYLRSVRSTLGAGGLEGFSIHIVLGGPEADVNTVASTLSLALHLSQKDVGGGVCVPVLAINGCGAVLPRETARYLQSLKVRETSLMWREEVDVMKFHHTGNLSLTLLTDDALDSSEYEMLASSITRVVHHHGQRDADQEDASSTAMAVAREILQEAAEHVRGVLGEVLGEALRLQKESLWIQHGRRSAQLEELVDSLEKWCAVTAAQHPDDAKLQDKDIDQLSLVLKEFTDGEMNLAITAVTMVTKDWYAYLPELKSVCHHHNYDCLVVVNETVDPPHHQVAVYSDHTDILNQICCELEESPCWSHSNVLEASECFQGSLQIYHVPVDTFSSPSMAAGLEEGLRSLLKAFMERRGSVLACHPTSRNSSTEGVAGSVEFSQGSSGINDMYGSDAERTCADEVSMAGEMADGEGESGGAGIGGGIGELVSPDSGMATIRSSRSSKESSVFLSDDSPIGEMVAGVAAGAGGLFLRNPSPLGFSSLSTPIPPERRKQRHSRNRSDNLDLFSFDPLHSGNPPMPAEGLLEHSEDSSRAESSSLSEFEELSLVDFSAPVPPTVNSLVGSCPPHHCGVSFFQQDRTRTIDLQHKDSVSSSLSEVWEEFGFDAKLKDTMGESMTSNEINVAESESMETFLEEKGFKVQEQTCILEDTRLKPLLSLVTETDNIWNLDSGFTQSLETATLADLQLTPPEENVDGKRSSVTGAKEELSSVYRKRELPDMLTPDSSKEEDDGAKERKGDRQIDLQDVWSFSAQRGLVKSGSGAAAYPESLDLWNTTIRDDSLSPLTTPDVEDLSERSDSLIGQVSSIEGGPLLESPLGYSECGMVMWNTTILEDNASSVTSPEGPGTGTDVGPSQDACSAGPDTNVSQRVQTQKQKYTINAVAERGVKIIIEEVDGGENDSVSHEPDQQNRMSEKWLNQASDQNLDSWTVPVPQMVNSTSEYENVGASAWSSPSPETHVSPAAHMMQLDRESSPFINVVPNMEDAAHFLYEGTELKHTTRSENVNKSEDNRGDAYDASDLKVQSVDDSPFILVDGSPLDTKSAGFQLSLGDAAMTQTGAHQTVKTDNSPLTTAESYRLTSYSDLSMDRKTKKRNSDPHIESRVLDGAAMDSTSVSPSSGGERDGLRFSRDSLHLSSRDDLRSNSDGDSSSGLEMESIVLSGSLTESKTERGNGFNRAWHSGRGTRVGKEETFSMLACAATRLKAQESRTHSRQNQMETENESPLSLNAGEKHAPSLQTSPDGQADVSIVLSGQSAYDKHTATQPLLREGKSSRESPDKSTTDTYGSRPCTTSIANTTKDYIVPEIICSNIAKRQPEIFLELNSTVICHSLSQAGEGITDYQSSITARSVPSSLRYPSDHFLKTREEVYVHSQISMEDSDDGVQSPSAPTYCPTTGNRIPPSTSEPASPELAHSSSSHNSSFITTPVSESGHPAEKVRVGSPFTGDLMEEVGNEEEEVGSAHPENQREGRAHITTPCPGPSEDLKGDSSSQLLLEPMTMRHLDELSSNQEIEGSPKYLPSQRHQEITSQPFDQPTCEYTLYQWTRDRSPTEYGYNYHHTDQRIECQSNHQGYVETSVDSTHLAGRSEMGFANRTIQTRPQQPQDGSGPKHQYSLGKLGQCKANLAINSGDTGGYPIEGPLRQIDKDGYETMRTSSNKAGGSERRSQYEDVVWSHCEAHNLQCDGQQFYPPAACHQSEDHAQYVPEGYTHFLLTRTCQQEDNAATTEMMKKVHFNEEDEGDHTEAVSNHRRKLAAPPLNVSLDHSEGSLTSDDGVETGDEALDTGDDLQLDLLDTTDGAESLEFNIHGECELSNQGAAAVVPEAIPEYSAAEECRDGDLWRIVVIGDQEHRVDMECIEPYRKVVSHGGYYGDQNAIIVFAACFLPDSNCENYNYVMENLFLYVISTLELMVADDYMIVYLNGATPRRRMPGFGWMKKCYQMIDRRLKKNLKLFIIVHPSWFIRTVLGLTRPFISFKFSSKIKYVHSLAELWVLVPMEYVYIPPSIVKYEEERRAHKFACMRLDEELQRTADKDKKGG